MKLSNRLQVVANLIDGSFIDVGCDHAYLSIYLARKEKISSLAIDQIPICVKQSLQNVQRSHTTELVSVIQNNGLQNLTIDSYQTIVLCGLGTASIIRIVEDIQTLPEFLIISSNNDVVLLRKTITTKGYRIIEEQFVCERGKHYIVIKFQKGFEAYTKEELEIGPYLRKQKDPIYFEWLQKQYQTRLQYEENMKQQNELKKIIQILQKER